MSFEQFWTYASPFLAAGLAAWSTHFFGFRRAKAERYLDQRLARLLPVHDHLSLIKNYCVSRVSEIEGSENQRPATELGDGKISALKLWHRLTDLQSAASVFLSGRQSRALNALGGSFGLLAGMERAEIKDPSAAHSGPYLELVKKADVCLGLLYDDLRMAAGA